MYPILFTRIVEEIKPEQNLLQSQKTKNVEKKEDSFVI